MSFLRSGVFLAPFHATRSNPTLSIERDLELLEHLDRLNYHEAWIGEHHSGGFELIACPEMFIAAAAQRTRHIRLGTGVVSLPYHNPFMLADRMVQLDHMTRGRAMFGVGPGALVHDALKIGIDPADQRKMMNEALEVIVPLLSGEMVNKKTDWFNLTTRNCSCAPTPTRRWNWRWRPARSPSGSLLAGKSRHRHAVDRRQRRRPRWNATPPIGGSTRRRARQRHTPDRQNWRIVGFFHIAETREQARKNVSFGSGVRQLFPGHRDISDHSGRCADDSTG